MRNDEKKLCTNLFTGIPLVYHSLEYVIHRIHKVATQKNPHFSTQKASLNDAFFTAYPHSPQVIHSYETSNNLFSKRILSSFPQRYLIICVSIGTFMQALGLDKRLD